MLIIIYYVKLQVDNLSFMELNEIRPSYSLAFKRLVQLDPQEALRRGEDDAGDDAFG